MKISGMMRLVVASFACVWLVSSCGSAKRLTYLQDMVPGEPTDVIERTDLHIKPGDCLDIVVTAQNPALATPFARMSSTPVVDPSTGEVKGATTAEDDKGYEVDKKGYIDFPVLGKLYIAGMTLEEVREFITNRIMASNYIKEPIVLVEFKNFNVIILGEGSAGSYTIQGESIDIFQFLAKTGDLTDYAKREEIWVIRNEDGKKVVYTLDLTSKSCYSSPAYYLQQDDMVYVKPRKIRMDGGLQFGLQLAGIFMTAVSMATMIILLVSKI